MLLRGVGLPGQRAEKQRGLVLEKRAEARKRPGAIAEQRQVDERRLPFVFESRTSASGRPRSSRDRGDHVPRLPLREGQHLIPAKPDDARARRDGAVHSSREERQKAVIQVRARGRFLGTSETEAHRIQERRPHDVLQFRRQVVIAGVVTARPQRNRRAGVRLGDRRGVGRIAHEQRGSIDAV